MLMEYVLPLTLPSLCLKPWTVSVIVGNVFWGSPRCLRTVRLAKPFETSEEKKRKKKKRGLSNLQFVQCCLMLLIPEGRISGEAPQFSKLSLSLWSFSCKTAQESAECPVEQERKEQDFLFLPTAAGEPVLPD